MKTTHDTRLELRALESAGTGPRTRTLPTGECASCDRACPLAAAIPQTQDRLTPLHIRTEKRPGLRLVERDVGMREAETMEDDAGKPSGDALARPSKKSTRSTIQDVAMQAGVTKSTVSKYLNAGSGGYYVSTRTRERIEAAIESLDFEPSLIAQGLTQNRTMTIGLIAADIRNPFYPDLVAGVQDVVEAAGYTLLLGSSNSDPEREMAIARSMIRRRVDGVILGSARMQAEDIESLMESGLRFVLASRDLPNLVTDSVTVDNRAGAELAVDHLIELGHRSIAHVAGPQDVVPFRNRLWGYRHALVRHGIDPDDALTILARSSTSEAGATATRTLLSRPVPPTAIFLGNDNMALGAMDAARQLGLRIPEDISIVGFDNIALAANSFISLTTIDSRAGELGAHAAQLLLDRLNAAELPPYDDLRTVVQRPILRVRGTTAPPLTRP